MHYNTIGLCYNMLMKTLLIQQIEGFLEEPDMTAALANVSSCIMQSYDRLNWAGFYYAKNGELILGPFQGKPACTHISFERGVCGETSRTKKPMRVDDVLAHKDHIACDADSRSELCVPVLVNGECVAEIDLDSPVTNRFTEAEEKEMLLAAECIASAWQQHHWPN